MDPARRPEWLGSLERLGLHTDAAGKLIVRCRENLGGADLAPVQAPTHMLASSAAFEPFAGGAAAWPGQNTPAQRGHYAEGPGNLREGDLADEARTAHYQTTERALIVAQAVRRTLMKPCTARSEPQSVPRRCLLQDCLRDGNPHFRDAAGSIRAVAQGDGAPVRFDDLAGEREAHAGTGFLRRVQRHK